MSVNYTETAYYSVRPVISTRINYYKINNSKKKSIKKKNVNLHAIFIIIYVIFPRYLRRTHRTPSNIVLLSLLFSFSRTARQSFCAANTPNTHNTPFGCPRWARAAQMRFNYTYDRRYYISYIILDKFY